MNYDEKPKRGRGRPPGTRSRFSPPIERPATLPAPRHRLYATGSEYLVAIINGEEPAPVEVKVKAAVALLARETTAPKGVKNLRQEAAVEAAKDAFATPAPPPRKLDA